MSQPESAPIQAGPVDPKLKGREVIVALCGSISCYKVAEVVSKLVQLGAGVTVVMSHEAQKFITPLTFEALSGRKVRTDLFELPDTSDSQHIALTERADLMLVVPATTHMIAKVAGGLCDDIVSLMVCASACPVVFAPAMNSRMWDNPIARQNVAKLVGLGYRFIGPEPGWLACRSMGMGRLSDPVKIIEELTCMLTQPGAMPKVVGGGIAKVE